MRYHHQQSKHIKAIHSLGLNATLIGLAYAAVETVWSIYIYSFFPNESQMGFVSAIFSLATLASLLFAFPLFKKFSPHKLLFASVGINSIILALFAHIHSPIMLIIFGTLNAILIGVRVQAFGVLLRHNSTNKKIFTDEKYVYLLMNIGWIIGPLVAGYIANTIATRAVMVFASIALLLSVYSITYNQKTFRKEKQELKEHISIILNIKDFFRNKKRILAYCLSGGLEVWWAIPYIFLPVIMIELYGFNIKTVGMFLFAIEIPLIITEYIMQKKDIKNIRKIMGIGFFIASAMALIAGLTGNIYIILGAFVTGSFGIGFVEPNVESFFFSITKEKESERFYGSFMTAKQVGSFVGKAIVATILLTLPIQVGILSVGLVVFILGIWSIKGK
ncbi:MFS transporter [Candidatus Woesearchaeota archaeon]|nr:MFS transporter [Candidatus Woesearchaeota archaeon]